MRKILFIDYLGYSGHKNFNKIHINALQRQGWKFDLVGVVGQFNNMNIDNHVNIIEIKEGFMTRRHASSLLSRLANILLLFKLRNMFKLSDYEYIIFPTYDVLSLFFFRTKQKVFLINHNNVSQLSSRIKLWMTKNLPLQYFHIALSQEMADRLRKLSPFRKCYYIPHGIIEPSNQEKKPVFIKEAEKYLFCPVNRNYDKVLLEKILTSQRVIKYLKKQNIRILIKRISDKICNSNEIFVIDSRLDKAEYDYLIKNACAVMIPYEQSFKYRCSGIMFESVAYKTPIIASDISALRSFENDCNISFFSDVKSFINSIEQSMYCNKKRHDLGKFNPYPYWKLVIEDIINSNK